MTLKLYKNISTQWQILIVFICQKTCPKSWKLWVKKSKTVADIWRADGAGDTRLTIWTENRSQENARKWKKVIGRYQRGGGEANDFEVAIVMPLRFEVGHMWTGISPRRCSSGVSIALHHKHSNNRWNEYGKYFLPHRKHTVHYIIQLKLQPDLAVLAINPAYGCCVKSTKLLLTNSSTARHWKYVQQLRRTKKLHQRLSSFRMQWQILRSNARNIVNTFLDKAPRK